MEASDNAVLLTRAAQGDQAAWDVLVDSYARLVWSVLAGFRLDQQSRDDVYQTVWLRLVEHLDRITHPERLAGWLATTTRNEALRVVRLQRRTRPAEDLGMARADDTQPTPEETVADAEERTTVLAAFDLLSDACRELLRLLTLDPPLDYATVAELLGRPIGSLGPTRSRCLAKLRTLLPEESR